MAQLTDGSTQEIVAVWESPTSPSVVLGGYGHERTRDLLARAHQQYLAGH